jgi:hypothetical protein
MPPVTPQVPIHHRAAGRAVLLALLLLAAVPAAAQARNHKVDGRVTGPPIAKGGSVTVPFQLSGRAGRAVKLGTRRVRVRFKRARLPLAGAPRAARVAPRALRAGFRLKGVTSLTKKSRRRLRYHARPTVKLRKVRVVRAVRRGRGTPAPPIRFAPQSRTPEQIVRDIGTRAAALSGRVGPFGSLTQQIDQLQTFALPIGIAGVTLAFESLTTALEDRAATEPELEPLLAEVEALGPEAQWLTTSLSAADSSVRTTRALAMIGDAVETLAVEAPLLATQIGLIQQIPGLLAQLTAIEDALIRIEARLGAVDAGTAALGSRTGELIAGMAALTDAAGALADDAQGDADAASLGAGVDALAADDSAVASGFSALQASVTELSPALDALGADAAALEVALESLEAFGMGGG